MIYGVDIKAPHTAEVIVPAMQMLVTRFIARHPRKIPSLSHHVEGDILHIEVSAMPTEIAKIWAA